MDVLHAFLVALWLFLPCYVANMTPVAAARLFPAWNAPLDGGRVAKDGERVLGDNKTWRGLVCGAFAAALTAALLAPLAHGPFAGYDFALSVAGWPGVVLGGFVLGWFALVGDAVKSYAKRSRKRPAGSSWFPFDQLDAVAGGLLGAVVAAPIMAGWPLRAYFGDWLIPVVLVLVTPALHWLSSVLAYWGGLKRAPW